MQRPEECRHRLRTAHHLRQSDSAHCAGSAAGHHPADWRRPRPADPERHGHRKDRETALGDQAEHSLRVRRTQQNFT